MKTHTHLGLFGELGEARDNYQFDNKKSIDIEGAEKLDYSTQALVRSMLDFSIKS